SLPTFCCLSFASCACTHVSTRKEISLSYCPMRWKGLYTVSCYFAAPLVTLHSSLSRVISAQPFPKKSFLYVCRVPPSESEPDINGLSFTELRDKLLALYPLDEEHIIKMNQEFGLDCGGQQWVSEACFPDGTFAEPSMKDLEYIEELKQLIERNGYSRLLPYSSDGLLGVKASRVQHQERDAMTMIHSHG
ncbi:hypothetical protein Ancab_031102, partial [Ancistrocladus abbreviatus]